MVVDVEVCCVGWVKEMFEVELSGNLSIVVEGKVVLIVFSFVFLGVWVVEIVIYEVFEVGYWLMI